MNEEIISKRRKSAYKDFKMQQEINIFEQSHWLLPIQEINKEKKVHNGNDSRVSSPTAKTIADWKSHISEQEEKIALS